MWRGGGGASLQPDRAGRARGEQLLRAYLDLDLSLSGHRSARAAWRYVRALAASQAADDDPMMLMIRFFFSFINPE